VAERRGWFGPVVLLGLASAGLTALAANRAWARAEVSASLPVPPDDTSASMPLVGALALVVLAGWGVVLVTRGRLRRIVALLGAAAALGALVVTLIGLSTTADAVRDDLVLVGVQDAVVARTAWAWLAVAAALASVATTAAAVRLVPRWPEMGSRYDAPGATAEPADPTSLDLWKALDAGRDPTLPPDAPPAP